MDDDKKISDVQSFYNDAYLEASETDRKYDDIAMLTPEERAQLTPVSPEDEQMTILFSPIDDQIKLAYYELDLRLQDLAAEEAAEEACERWYDRQSAHEDVVYARGKVNEIRQQIKELEEAKENGRKRKIDVIPR